MILLNMSDPLTLLLMLAATVLLIFLAQEVKKSAIAVIPLLVFLAILILHVVQVSTLDSAYAYMASTIYRCIAIDFIFILVSFLAYLWVDDIEAKAMGKKSIDNSLDWFWKNV